MRIEQFQYFEKIYDEKSISKAADKLFASRPAVSIAISNLEKELGVQLFARNKDGLNATTYGEQIIDPVREILRNLNVIQERVEERRTTIEIHILSISSVASIILPNVVSYLSRKFQNLDIYLEEATYNDLLDIVLEKQQRGESFFCIYALEQNTKKNLLQQMKQADITTVFLAEDRTYCCFGKNLFSQQENIVYDDYLRQTIVDYAKTVDRFLPEIKDESSWKPFAGRYIYVSNMEMLKQAICDNLGVALLPGILLYEEQRIKSGDLRFLEIQDVAPNRIQYYLFYPKRDLEPYEAFFVKLILEEFRNFQEQSVISQEQNKKKLKRKE